MNIGGRHKWKKKTKLVFGKDKAKRLFLDQGGKVIPIDGNIYICVNCGLRRGHCRFIGHFPVLMYFKYGIVLSTDTIPYMCDEGIGETDFLFSKEDFNV